jgi:hypothetical protein
VRSESLGRELELSADHSSCGGRSVADKEGALLVRDATTREVRRRILEAQLSRLFRRMDDGPCTADLTGRAARLIARLERDDLDW